MFRFTCGKKKTWLDIKYCQNIMTMIVQPSTEMEFFGVKTNSVNMNMYLQGETYSTPEPVHSKSVKYGLTRMVRRPLLRFYCRGGTNFT